MNLKQTQPIKSFQDVCRLGTSGMSRQGCNRHIKPVEEIGLKRSNLVYLNMESMYNWVNFRDKKHSHYTGAFHAREDYQTVGCKAIEEGVSRLAAPTQEEKERSCQAGSHGGCGSI